MTEVMEKVVERCGCKTSDETGTINGYTCPWHRARLLAALKLKERRVWAAAMKRVAEEPELPGEMPDEIWTPLVLNMNRESVTVIMRQVVVATKLSIVFDFQRRVDALDAEKGVEEVTAETSDRHFGEDCPKGMVQVEFVGVDPKLRYSDYGWKPSEHAFLEVWVDGRRFRIDVGDYESTKGKRRGLHVVSEVGLEVDKHSLNAVDLWIEQPTIEESRR